jgi:hypothetical protein
LSSGKRSLLGRLRAGLRHAFSLESPLGPLTEADRALLRRLAVAIVVRRMGMPAVLFLQSLRPLSYMGSQAMTFLRPFVASWVKTADYDRLTEILERREGIGALVEAIEVALGRGEGEAR